MRNGISTVNAPRSLFLIGDEPQLRERTADLERVHPSIPASHPTNSAGCRKERDMRYWHLALLLFRRKGWL